MRLFVLADSINDQQPFLHHAFPIRKPNFQNPLAA